MISAVLAEQFIIVALEKRDDGMYLGRFEDPNIPRKHEIFFECKARE